MIFFTMTCSLRKLSKKRKVVKLVYFFGKLEAFQTRSTCFLRRCHESTFESSTVAPTAPEKLLIFLLSVGRLKLSELSYFLLPNQDSQNQFMLWEFIKLPDWFFLCLFQLLDVRWQSDFCEMGRFKVQVLLSILLSDEPAKQQLIIPGHLNQEKHLININIYYRYI